MSSGDVYTVQDVYGMSTSQNENDADCSTANGITEYINMIYVISVN